MGCPSPRGGQDAKGFGHQTLRDNVALLEAGVLKEINARVAAAGRAVFAPTPGAPLAPLAIKVDPYVLATDGHFPTDRNRRWDAGRKGVDLILKYRDPFGDDLPGWRKAKDWRRQLTNGERAASQTVYRGGPHKAARIKRVVRAYLAVGRALAAKVGPRLLDLCDQSVRVERWAALACFHGMLTKHLDLVDRRLLPEETIPAHEQVFSLFEPHTAWKAKGKHRPAVELGHPLLLASCQHQLIHDDDVPVGELDRDQSVPVADRLPARYGEGNLASLSFDQGCTRRADRELLNLYLPTVVMPKRGKQNAAETAQEHGQQFVVLRHAHSAVERAINSLEQHGLDRCLDVGLAGYLRYVGYGVLSYNLHVIGRELLAREWLRVQPARMAA